ncbi:MAG: IS110 family transposase [Bacteroidota bacterium]
MYYQNLGVDVSAKTLQVCLKVRRADGQIKIKGSRKFPNTQKGFTALVSWVTKKRIVDQPMRVTMEATGVYYESLAYYLHDQQWEVFVLLPNRIKGYFKFLNLKSKTDKIEANALAELGINQSLPLWEPASPVMYTLKRLSRERNTLVDEKTVIANRLHAEKACKAPNGSTMSRLKQMIKLLNKQIKQVEQEMEQYIQQDPLLKQQLDNICQVKGLGWLTVISVIAETNGFKLIQHKSQLVSYAGYDVVERQSGSSVNGKTKISKKGNRHIRRALHFPALSVVKYHQEFKQLHKRIVEKTQIKMKGYTAVQRKLLVLIYTLYKKKQAYDPNYFKNMENQKNRQGTMPAYTG